MTVSPFSWPGRRPGPLRQAPSETCWLETVGSQVMGRAGTPGWHSPRKPLRPPKHLHPHPIPSAPLLLGPSLHTEGLRTDVLSMSSGGRPGLAPPQGRAVPCLSFLSSLCPRPARPTAGG